MRMGTQVRILVYAPSFSQASEASMAAFDRMEQLEWTFSDYRTNSELSRLNRDGAIAPRRVSDELFQVLHRSLEISSYSRGAFDITLGPLTQLWRQARRAGSPPTPKQIAQARRRTGFQNLILNSKERTVRFELAGMALDLGGIAKGYIADQALQVLQRRGLRSALVEAGGDIAIGAAPPGKAGWHIAIKGVQDELLALHDVGVATSGDEFQYLEIAGRRYSHIINPAIGVAVSDSSQVTVIAPDGMTADALATTLSVMTPAAGLELADSLDGVAAFIRSRSNEALRSRRFPSGRPALPPMRAGFVR
ncbi:MAG: FAD:protein FMN transferase [Acidobacteriota bacterium]